MDLKEIYRKSWDVVIKHKALWVIGAAVAAFAGGGFRFNNSFNSGGDSINSLNKLGNTNNFQPIWEYFLNIFRSIPTTTWILLGLAFLTAIIVGIILSLVAGSWAVGSLIGGIEEALDGKNPTIKSSSLYGLKNLKSIVWLRFVPGFLFSVVLILLTIISALLLSLSKPFGLLLIFVAVLFALIAVIILTIVQVWASRIAVIEGKGGKEAFFEAWKLGKSNFLDMLGLGTVNCFAGCLVGCGMVVVLIPLGALGFGTFVATGVFSAGAKNYYALVPALGIVLLLVILAGVVITLVMSIYTVFNYSTWNVLYRQIRAKEKEGKKDGK